MKMQYILYRLINFFKYILYSKSIYNIHSPFLYEFTKECLDKNNRYYLFDTLSELREKLQNDHTKINYLNLGAPSNQLKKQVKRKDIVNVAVSPEKYSELYFRICLFFKAKKVLELGTSIGLNTLYLAHSSKSVISIEGQQELCQYAQNLLKQNNIQNTHIICSEFDKVLQQIVSENQLDIVIIDGNHTYEATMRYFNTLKPSLSKYSAIIIDDIYWSKEMTKAWKGIIHQNEIKVSIDLYRCGIIIFNPDFVQSQHLILRY